MNIKFDLNKNWEFSLQSKSKYLKENKWFKAEVPGTIYHNLLKEKLIDDPFNGDNELRLQWVAESDWSYQTSFENPRVFRPDSPVLLVFEGLDTAAEVILNDRIIGSPDNMFRRWEYDVTSLLKKKNILRLNFISPYKYAKSQEAKYGKLPVALNSERVYIRKAQYSFGWDWGPSFADIGVWKPVFLVQNEETYIKDFTFSTLNIDKSDAEAEVIIRLNKSLGSSLNLMISISDEKGTIDFPVTAKNGTQVKEVFRIHNPILWWPNGEGDQHLYSVSVKLQRDGKIIDEVVKKTGIRKIKLHLKEKDANTFHFTVNGRRIFAKGANWIPADSFLTRVSKEKYSALLSLAKEASMNFIRVWGGGSYESDIFYELCDKYGLLVWQDFMFACASYPEHKEFLDNVATEIEENVKRLQHHPSIALWCGNNENEWIWYQQKKKSYKSMSGYQIYSSLIPDILKEIDPKRPYWESSPFSFEDDPNSVLSGNRHQWDLWSNWKDYNTVKNDFSLFVTEFGFQGPANQSTFEKVLPVGERNPMGYLFEFHNKQVEGNERMFKFLSGHLPVRTEWKDFIYLAQLNQGFALKTCVEHWRFHYPRCNGSIIWQLNDCWPVSSWALIDSELQPKLSYYLVKNSFHDPFLKFTMNKDELHLHLINNREIFNGYLILSEIDLPSGKTVSKKIKLKAETQKTLLKVIKRTDELERGKIIASATLYDEQEEFLHRAVFTQPEWKYLSLPKVKIRWKLVNKKENQYISLKTDKPAFYVSIFAEGLLLKNNAVSILPGEELLLPVVKNLMKDKIKLNIFSLNDYLSDVK